MVTLVHHRPPPQARPVAVRHSYRPSPWGLLGMGQGVARSYHPLTSFHPTRRSPPTQSTHSGLLMDRWWMQPVHQVWIFIVWLWRLCVMAVRSIICFSKVKLIDDNKLIKTVMWFLKLFRANLSIRFFPHISCLFLFSFHHNRFIIAVVLIVAQCHAN